MTGHEPAKGFAIRAEDVHWCSATVCPECGLLLRLWSEPNFQGYELEIHPEHGDRNLCEDCVKEGCHE